MSEWNATAVHYGVLQITAGATRFSGKITGGLSPAVKSGEQITKLTEDLLCDTIRRKKMDDLKRLCDKFIYAYIFDESDAMLSGLQFYRERDKLSEQQKADIDAYFIQQCNDYRLKFKNTTIKRATIGTIESHPIKYFKE